MRLQTVVVVASVLLLAVGVGQVQVPRTPWSKPSTVRMIVLFDGTVKDAPGAAKRIGNDLGFAPDRVFTTAVRGFAARIPEQAAEKIRHRPGVVGVFPDLTVSVAATVPTGVDRVGAEDVNGTGRAAGAGAAVAVLDTGIAGHPDLTIAGGYNCTSSDTTAWGDAHGHGTHVAGIIGARGGIQGVAPGTPLYAVKVLDDRGSGTWSSVLCGLDWVAGSANGGVPLASIVNMSLSGTSDEHASLCSSSPFHEAVCTLTSKGVRVVVAAGNGAQNAGGIVPAKYPEVIAVSALNDTDGCSGGLGPANSQGSDDRRATFSNTGAVIDVAAPGVDIYSTAAGGGYVAMSGTSMASPHVAGLIALGGYVLETSSFGESIAVMPGGNRACAPDTTAPETEITAKPDAETGLRTAQFTYRANEAKASFECSVDGAAFKTCPADGFSVANLADGAHTFAVRAVDAAGNRDGSPATATWRVIPAGELVVSAFDNAGEFLPGGCYEAATTSGIGAGQGCDADDGATDGITRFVADAGTYVLTGGPATFDSASLSVKVRSGETTEVTVNHVLAPTPTPSPTPQQDDDDGRTLVLNAALSGTIATKNDVDRYQFKGSAGQRVAIAMTAPVGGSLDAEVVLLGPAGKSLATSDDEGGGTDALLDGYRLPANGLYTVLAKSNQGASTGTYQIIVAGDGEHTRLLTAGSPRNGQVLPGNEKDVLGFDGQAGQRVTITMRARTGSTVDSYLEIYGPDGTRLKLDDDSGGKSDALITLKLPKSGRYRIVATCYNRLTTGGYTISVSLTAAATATRTPTPKSAAAGSTATPKPTIVPTRTATVSAPSPAAATSTPTPSPTAPPPTATPSPTGTPDSASAAQNKEPTPTPEG